MPVEEGIHVYGDTLEGIQKDIVDLTIMLLFGIIASINSPLCIVMFFSFFTVSLLGNVMCDIRYWNQIAELRADRLAVEKYKCDKMSCVTFWKEDSKNHNQNNNNDNNENSNIIVKIYRNYVKISGHPSMERRMYLIEKRDRWHWWEYLEHALIVLKWRITNKGWNGEE